LFTILKLYSYKLLFFQLYFIVINDYSVNAGMIIDFMILRLLQKFKLKEIVWRLLIFFKKEVARNSLIGYKLMVNGRFNRRVRVTYFWKLDGRVPVGARLGHVSYSKNTVNLKHGICSVKVWLTYAT